MFTCRFSIISLYLTGIFILLLSASPICVVKVTERSETVRLAHCCQNKTSLTVLLEYTSSSCIYLIGKFLVDFSDDEL